MVSVNDIKEFLMIPIPTETSLEGEEEITGEILSADDKFIQKLIDRTESQIKAYCNNDFEEGLPLDLEDILIQWVAMKYDTNTRLKSGKSGQSMGQLSISYLNEIPREFKSILNLYRRIKTL